MYGHFVTFNERKATVLCLLVTICDCSFHGATLGRWMVFGFARSHGYSEKS